MSEQRWSVKQAIAAVRERFGYFSSGALRLDLDLHCYHSPDGRHWSSVYLSEIARIKKHPNLIRVVKTTQ